MITFQYLKEFCQPLIERSSLFPEVCVHLFAQFNDVLFAVDQRPDETSQLVQMDMGVFRAVEAFLSEPVKETGILNIQGHNALFVRFPGEK